MTTIAPAETPGTLIKAAGHRLVGQKGSAFTTQDVIREAGVALQTFYRYFAGKDQLILALIADLISAHCEALSAATDGVADPVERLEIFVRSTLAPLQSQAQIAGAQFVTAEHWRLHQLFPTEVRAATQPFTDLIRRQLEVGQAAGLLSPRNAERDAWLINNMVMSAYHHYSFQPDDPAMATVAADVWSFCLAAVKA